MCSFLFSTSDNLIERFSEVNKLLKLRGPDKTQIKKIDNMYFLHNLLSMTGKIIPQPFVKNGIVCLYNGEIYNYKNFGTYDSDGECLIPLYEEKGEFFAQHLDGEFALLLVDTNARKIIVSSDIFRTKPLFISLKNSSFGCSTFKTPLQIIGHESVESFPPNTIRVYNLDTFELQTETSVYQFDINQFKNSYDDWDIAFENSIKKRTDDFTRGVFIGLSSGYDSGAICFQLLKQKIPFKSYTITGTENDEILYKRFEIIKLMSNNESKSIQIQKTDKDYVKYHEYVLENTEPFRYTICSINPYTKEIGYIEDWFLTDDYGSKWLACVCDHAKKDGKKMYLSGMGADELFSDYGFGGKKIFDHSNFGGKFPEDLSKIFPWNSFYKSSMESYLAKEEYISGSFGLEARYPFLDKQVVQEFLWLNSDLKNAIYKSVIDNFLEKRKFPFCKGEKKGF